MKIITTIRKPFKFVLWNAAFILIGINLMVYLFTWLNPQLGRLLSMNPLFVIKGSMYWQVFTYQFVHGDLSHLFFNMLALFFFGSGVEQKIGSKEFLVLYLISATLCGFFSLIIYIITGAWYVFLMGASGAIFSLLLAYAVLFPHSRIYIWGIIPIQAPLLVIGYAGIEVFNILTGSNQGVAHSTHLIGFIVGWLYFLIRFGINPLKVWNHLE